MEVAEGEYGENAGGQEKKPRNTSTLHSILPSRALIFLPQLRSPNLTPPPPSCTTLHQSVYVDCMAHFLKLRIHRCYINKFNLYNQVGIVAVNIIGESDPSSNPSNPPPASAAFSPPNPIGGVPMQSPLQQLQPATPYMSPGYAGQGGGKGGGKIPEQARGLLEGIAQAKMRAVQVRERRLGCFG